MWESKAEKLYCIESFGDMPTRRGKIEKLIRLLSKESNPWDFGVQCRLYNQVGIDSDTFTPEEERYIVNEVSKKHE